MAKKKPEVSTLETLMDTLNDAYGENTVVRIDHPTMVPGQRIPSGSLVLDDALSGGYGTGRIIEVYGGESSGKTTLALSFLAGFQGQPVLFIDAEHALNRDYAKTLGVDMDNLIITQPDYLEMGLDIAEKMCGEVAAIVFDSVAGSPPKKEIEGTMEDEDIGVKAKRMSRAMRIINPKIAKSGCTVLFINQTRDKIGPFAGKTRPGGNALKFHASQTLSVYTTSQGKIKSGEEQIGHYLNVEVIKNKLGSPYRKCKIPIIYGQGISMEQEVMDIAIAEGVIEKSGSWLSYNGAKLGQGAVNARMMLEDNPELVKEIADRLRGE